MQSTTLVRSALACALACSFPAAHADVSTKIEFFEDIGSIVTYDQQAARVVSDAQSIDNSSVFATGEASADLGTGELKARATGYRRLDSELSLAARATGKAMDVLTIDGPGTDAIPVTFEMAVTGDLIPPDSAAGAANAFALVRAVVDVNGSPESATVQWLRGYDAAGAVSRDVITGLGDWTGAAPAAGTNHFDLLLSYTADIVPGTPFDFSSELQAYVGSTGTLGSEIVSDFGHTGLITIVLPQNYTLSSQSGVFLAGPIPEPETWALFGTGVGMIALGLRRRGGSRG